MAAASTLCASRTQLSDDDRIFVIRALTQVAHKWRRIGDALGLSTSTLEQIGQGPSDEALSTMVCKWLAMSYNIERFPKPSWDALVKAIAEPAGADNRKVAEEMARNHPREPEDVDGYTPGKSELDGHDWFHRKLSRDDSVTKLREAGQDCFLVRESTARPNQLTISLVTGREVRHFKIVRGVNCCEVEGTFRKFFTIPEMVKHYEDHSLTDNSNDKLTKPCPR